LARGIARTSYSDLFTPKKKALRVLQGVILGTFLRRSMCCGGPTPIPDALVTVLWELPATNKSISRLIDDLLSAKSATTTKRYGAARSTKIEPLVNGSQQFIIECCITIA
jgi:hypothetical protein